MKQNTRFKTQSTVRKHTDSKPDKTLIFFLKRNLLLFAFTTCFAFIGIVAFYKIFASKPTYIYAKIKVGQGMWWANTQKPSLWFVRAVQKASEAKDLIGRPIVSVLNVSYYPYIPSSTLSVPYDQYDIYVTVKLKVSSDGKKDIYTFNRDIIGVSSPITLEFPNVQFSGTVISLSRTPLQDKYIKKTIYLTKYSPRSWEYEQIFPGDSQSDGKQMIFKILDKSYDELYTTLTVRALIQVKDVNDQYIFGEEYVVAPGKILQGVATKNFTFTDYYITKVE
jgi:hypothetical protein